MHADETGRLGMSEAEVAGFVLALHGQIENQVNGFPIPTPLIRFVKPSRCKNGKLGD